jgi:hypothetical protein
LSETETPLLQELGETETENSPTQNSETETGETGVNAKLKANPKAESFEPKKFYPNSEKPVSKNGSLTISARSGYFSFRKVSKSLRQLKTAVTKISIYSNFAEIVKEPKK